MAPRTVDDRGQKALRVIQAYKVYNSVCRFDQKVSVYTVGVCYTPEYIEREEKGGRRIKTLTRTIIKILKKKKKNNKFVYIHAILPLLLHIRGLFTVQQYTLNQMIKCMQCIEIFTSRKFNFGKLK